MRDRAGDFGGIDAPSLSRIRNLWIDMEPLVTATGYDDVTNPSELRVELSDGIGEATRARIDIQWSDLGYYSFHYTDDSEVNWRFDHHPNPHSAEKHFHPPPMASTPEAEPSCIEVETPELVARAVYELWRLAYEEDDVNLLNSASNPP